MPPKRRRPQSPPPPQPSPDRQQTPSLAEEDIASASEAEGDDDDEHDSVAFYNTTFTAHRVSPLYLGRDGNKEALTPNRLAFLSQHLRDRLVGDVIRGVEVGGGGALSGREEIAGRAGALEGVEIRWVNVARDIFGFVRGEEVEEGWLQGKMGLSIVVKYEMAVCTALLLPRLSKKERTGGEERREDGFGTEFAVGAGEMDWQRDVDPGRFLELPLLLLRMPAPLQAAVAEFLAMTFDCRVSPMRLGTRTLVQSWEAWLRSAGLPARGSRDMVLTLGFYLPSRDKSNLVPVGSPEEDATKIETLGLKSIDVMIPAGELHKFVAAGKRLSTSQNGTGGSGWGWESDAKKRRILAGRLYEEGWEWRTDGSPEQQPFSEALACYLKEHLALNLFHPGVRVLKIACSGFALSDTRLKVFTPASSGDGQRSAVVGFLGRLAEKARGRSTGT